MGVQTRRPAGSVLAPWLAVAAAAVIAAGGAIVLSQPRRAQPTAALPTAPASYLGLFEPHAPASYAGLASFARATGVSPNIVSYYSGWLEPFMTRFAISASKHDAVPLVQIDPTGVSIAAIASGRYDRYLSSYARAVAAYGRPVILSFGHEMNASWYSWGYRHTQPRVFVAAWRHVVRLFRASGARNVTWMWTVNAISQPFGARSPAAWWPGASYVTWVGIDGYFSTRSSQFASVFGPTIVAVRELTQDPILIAETGATAAVGQASKIAQLFAGVRTYRLLGFLWFDAVAKQDFRILNPASIAAYRHGAVAYTRAAQVERLR